MSTRKRKNYLKDNIIEGEKPIYFEEKGYKQCPIVIVEEKPIEIDGVKPGSYIANNIGQVFNKNGKEIKPNKLNTGYYNYRLVTGEKKPKYKHILAHRLFMETFKPIENPEEYTVNHRNMDKSKNELDNLEWVSQKENNDKKDEVMLLDGTKNYHALFSFEDLKIIVDELEKYTTYSEILNILGKPDTKVNRDYIGNIKRGKTYKRELKMILDGKVQRLEGESS